MSNYYHNENLFSEIYLEEITQQTEDEDVLASLKVLSEYRDFAETDSLIAWKKTYVHEVLSALGFFAQSISTSTSINSLKNENITRLFPMGSSGEGKPLSLCYILMPEENLDNTTIGRNWAEKIVRVLRENNLQWGLLTNGKQWRIYHQDEPTSYETYLEIDLEAILKEKARKPYQIFYKFMKAENFAIQEDGNCQFDRFKQESHDKISYIEKELANALKQREEGGKGVLSDLCMGYVKELRQRKDGDLDDEGMRKKIYHAAMLYMFRLLFLFYADARGLLSDKNNELLTKVENECRSRHGSNDKNDPTFPIWDSLEKIFVDIDTTYNGGLFSPQESEYTRFISETRIEDVFLANVIFNLTTYKEKNGREKPISYRDMGVRHLGTLYEGLLEHKLFIAAEDTEVKVTKGKIQFVPASKGGKIVLGRYIRAGEVYFANDPSERKSTGSYYTPEYIVDYIVRNTVGEKLKELKDVFLQEQSPNLEAYANSIDIDERSTFKEILEEELLSFVREKVLNLSVLDPAMGSGHFLVNATNLISNFITQTLNETGIQGDLETGTRYWRRWVVENCIYGVDLNPLAVELAKLSIWILAMAKDQPLSFLNHHFKCGNSLIGTRLDDIGKYPFTKTIKELRQLTLFECDPDFKAAVEKVFEKNRLIARKCSDSLEDIREKKIWLEEIDQTLKVYKTFCDIHTSLYFNNKVKEEEYKALVENQNLLLAYSATIPNNYFHWELEFPEVFLKSQKGFLSILTNPPYIDGRNLNNQLIKFISQKYQSGQGKINTFSLFLEKVTLLLNSNGLNGIILPIPLIKNERYWAIRKFILENSQIVNITIPTDKVFEEAVVESVILINRKGYRNKQTRINEITTKKEIIRTKIDSTNWYVPPAYYWFISPSKSIDLLTKIENENLPLSFYCEIKDGISTGFKPTPERILGHKDGDLFVSLNGERMHFNSAYHKPIIDGGEFQRFTGIQWKGRYIWYDKKHEKNPPPPKGKSFNCQLREQWIFETTPRIIYRQTSDRLISTIILENYYTRNSIHNVIIKNPKEISLFFILGVLNSNLLNWIYRTKSQETGKVHPQVHIKHTSTLPIPKFNFPNDQFVRSQSIFNIDLPITNNIFQKMSPESMYTNLTMCSKPELYDLITDLSTTQYSIYNPNATLSHQNLFTGIKAINRTSNEGKYLSSDQINMLMDLAIYAFYGINYQEIEIIHQQEPTLWLSSAKGL